MALYFDSERVSIIKNPPPALATESRCILVLLGFNGVRDFAKRSGVNHDTAAGVLGTKVQKNQTHYTIIIQIYETLHSAWLERREILNRAAQAYVKDWVKRWRKQALSGLRQEVALGKRTKNTAQAERLRKAITVSLKQVLDSLKWE